MLFWYSSIRYQLVWISQTFVWEHYSLTSDFITTVRGLCNFCCKSNRDAAVVGVSKEVCAEEGVVRGDAKDEVNDAVKGDVKEAGIGCSIEALIRPEDFRPLAKRCSSRCFLEICCRRPPRDVWSIPQYGQDRTIFRWCTCCQLSNRVKIKFCLDLTSCQSELLKFY